MKKVLLAGTALVGAALIASPAQAQLKLDLGGHFSGYGVYVNEDQDDEFDNFAFRRNTEIHFTGETTLDNGLTVGFHTEMRIDSNRDETDDPFNGNLNNESYAYFSGGWGRVNFGNEDGSAYLLQVAAPSADSNVDGLRTTIAGFQSEVGPLDYAHADFGNGPEETNVNRFDSSDAYTNSVDRLTYLTPKFNGFQAGVSYAPRAEPSSGVRDLDTNANTDDLELAFDDLWEIAARWDGQFEGVGISVGAGYSSASVVDNEFDDDLETWNVGLNLAWNQFSFGAAYKESNNAEDDADTTIWVVGAAWDNGPWHVGASYLAREDENFFGAGDDADSWKAAFGGGYTFGPGMSFRGTVAFGDAPLNGEENDFTQVTVGTDIRF